MNHILKSTILHLKTVLAGGYLDNAPELKMSIELNIEAYEARHKIVPMDDCEIFSRDPHQNSVDRKAFFGVEL